MILFLSVGTMDKIFFSKHLMMLIRAGVTLPDAVDIIAKQSKSESLRMILEKVVADIHNASSLAESLSPFNKYFGEFFITTIKLGEEKGTLEENLLYLTKKLERDFDFNEKLKTAAFYPALLFGTLIVLGFAIYFYVLPNLVKLFASFKSELPLPTRVLLYAADHTSTFGPIIILVTVALVFFFPIAYRMPKFRNAFDAVRLRIPVFGSIFRNLTLAQIHQNLGVLVRIGVGLPETLVIVGQTTTNSLYKNEVLRMAEFVRKGNTMGDAFLDDSSKIFPILSQKMLVLSEQSGTLSETSIYLADFYDSEASRTLSRLSTVLEPMLLLGIGLIIAFVAFAILEPIYGLTNSMSETRG
ncbi:MAG: type II secretion system F family protein [bacterium]